ncbi:MAG: virulence-associated E family protein [Vallitalea sp.]|nr:virulence-associated E family protein [Vallitalea sp.]
MNLKYDGELSIAFGRSRREKKWKNKEILWSEFVKRLSKTTRTAETHNEYMASPKSRQAEIKDVGAFVGGYLSQGVRKADSVQNRTVITLDIDHAKADNEILETFDMLYGNAAVIYSTHKHTPENPKLRLVIPINRPVFADEYEAISRRIAGDLGINDFDDTTFQPSRLMYFPSTSKDGEYVFKEIDASWLNADEILNTYFDWKDSSSWPVSDRIDKIVTRNIKKQGDPLEKPGLIGAFCRCYNIHEAIEKYLQDDYEECGIEGRYTYKHGSTAAGLITYDDKFAYSHHGTDPSSGKLCNAFDLVRIHMFGLKDEDAKEGTPVVQSPSFKEMLDFCSKDVSVRLQLSKEKEESISEDFNDGFELDGIEIDDSWKAGLEYNGKGVLAKSLQNLILILKKDFKLKDIVFNELSGGIEIIGKVPWKHKGKYWRDADDSQLISYVDQHHGSFSARTYEIAVTKVTDDRSYHPIKEYLKELPEWDGCKRLDTLLIDYLGAEDNEYVRTVTRKVFVGAIARVYKPGVKFDWMLVLSGGQGIGKSTLVQRMAGEWFNDSLRLSDTKDKTAAEKLQGYWILEIGELAGMRKTEENVLKNFLSSQNDVYRASFGRRAVPHPRQCIFIGTTNESEYLRDVTGDRRFWPIKVHSVEKKPWEITDNEVSQLWTEALQLYNDGERLELPSNIEEQARKAQSEAAEVDARQGIVDAFLDMELPKDWSNKNLEERLYWYSFEENRTQSDKSYKREEVCIPEIWCEAFKKEQIDLDNISSREIGRMLRRAGWEPSGKSKRFKDYRKQKVWSTTRNDKETKNSND